MIDQEPFAIKVGRFYVQRCKSNEEDFQSPSVTPVADFLLHLFKDGNLQPSTMEGYSTAFADMVGHNRLHQYR